MRKTGSNGGKDGTFGAPKPLPGQPGYRATESDVLHNETKEMEARLQVLQEKLKESQIETDKPITSNSSKWKSSSTDKGTIRAYGKEVTEKFKKRIVNEGGVIPTVINPPGAMKTSSLHTSQNPSPFSDSDPQFSPPPINFSSTTPTITVPSNKAPSSSSSDNFSTKPADTWTVDDVADWLRMMKLDQYVGIFQANQISGSVLLEFTLDDLDYLQITILGHRKTLLRAINDLKQSNPNANSSLNTPSFVSGGKISGNTVVASGLQRSQSSTRMAEGEKALLSKSMEVNKKPVHWSQIDPISTNKVKGDGHLSVNAADKPHSDFLDEEAERQAFMEAVAEWRREGDDSNRGGPGKITIVREYPGGKPSTLKTSSATSKPSADDGNWKNPFAAPSPPASKGPSSLLSGQADLDEEAERQAFMEAVSEWRKEGGDGGKGNTGTITIVREYPGGKTSTLKTSSASKTSVEDGNWKNPLSDPSPASKAPSSLLSGQLDEEQEHAEFVKAVEAWRGNKRSSNNNNNESVTPRGIAVGETSNSPNDKTKLLAENLAKQLEREQKEFLEKIERQKQEAEKRLYIANLELEKIRRNKLIQSTNATSFDNASPNSQASSTSSFVIESQAKSHDFEEVKVSISPHKKLSREASEQKVYTYVKEPVMKEVSYNDSDDEGAGSNRIHSEQHRAMSDRPNTVKIALVESILTSPLDNNRSEGKFSPREEEEGFCVIEYESDD